MNAQNTGQPAATEPSTRKLERAATLGLLFGIGGVLLGTPAAFVGGGMLYWLLRGVTHGVCLTPLCPLSGLIALMGLIRSAAGMRSSRRRIALVGLILSIVAVILGIVAAVLAVMDASQVGGIV